MKNFIDKTSEQAGTPINREAMMALQGFQASSIEFRNDGAIVETNSEGHTLTTTFDEETQIIDRVFLADGRSITLRLIMGFKEITKELL